ncbi:tetratricopeptide repeat protein, partial [Candidatus Omnitrophota bacterium]
MLKARAWIGLLAALLLAMPTSALFAQTEQQTSEDLYLANKAFADGFFEIALKHFQQYLQENPQAENKNEVNILIGRCQMNLEQFSESLQIFAELSQLSREAGLAEQIIYWTAQTYFRANDYENALHSFEALIERYPDSEFLPQSRYYRASCYYKRREFTRALELYREFNQKFSNHQLKEQSAFRIAQCFYNSKNYSQAYKEFKLFARNFSESTRLNAAFYFLGEIEYILGNFKKAIDFYAQAVEISPKDKVAGYANYSTGWAYLKLKEYEQAQQFFEGLKASPDFSP